MNLQAYRRLSVDGKNEFLYAQVVQISILKREVKDLKTELFYLKNRFDDFKRKGKKKKELKTHAS